MLKHEVIALLQDLPVNLIFKCEGESTVYFTQSFMYAFGNTLMDEDKEKIIPELKFFDPMTKQELSDHLSPFAVAESGTRVCQWVRLQTRGRSLQCFLESNVVNIEGYQWVFINAKLVQNNLFLSDEEISPVGKHITFSRLMTTLSAQLINSTENNKDAIFHACLGAFGTFCDVDRCYLFELAGDKSYAINTHEWVAAGVTPFKDELQHLELSSVPYFKERIFNDGVFIVNDVDKMPPRAESEKNEFIRQSIHSVLIVAIKNSEEIIGFVGCDIVGSPYHWKDYDINYLQRVGEMLGNTLIHIQNQRALANAQRELVEANAKLKQLANSDGLTGLANRRLFDDTLKRDILYHTHNHLTLTLLLIDVDKFKLFNDAYGHLEGDGALKHVAEVLQKSCVGNDDIVCRFGGEEFAVILPNTCQEVALKIAQRIQQNIRLKGIPFVHSEFNHQLTVSVGLASTQAHIKTTPNALIKRADNALYEAKSAGRNTIKIG